MGTLGITVPGSNLLNDETDRFLKAKSAVFDRDWNKAKSRLEAYLKIYPKGRYRDEALYWLARVLDKLSVKEKSVSLMMTKKESAFDHLHDVIQNHPQSLWRDDALSMMTDLAGHLALLGDDRPSERIRTILISNNLTLRDLKKAGLGLLPDLKPIVSGPLIRRILENEPDAQIRRFVLQTAVTYFPEETLDVLAKVSTNDPDEALRKEAGDLLRQAEAAAIPVELYYYGYTAKLNDEKTQKKIPENKINVYSVEHSGSDSERSARRTVEKLFEKELDEIKLATISRGGSFFINRKFFNFQYQIADLIDNTLQQNIQKMIDKSSKASTQTIVLDSTENARLKDDLKLALSLNTLGMPIPLKRGVAMAISHSFNDFRVSPLSDGFQKTYDDIRGQVSFFDTENEKEYIAAYCVDNTQDQVIAMRKGKDVSLILLRFVSELDEEIDEKEPVYRTTFNDVLGATVRSSRQSWNAGEMGRVNETMDFSEAKVEIKGELGKWVLKGNIISDGKKRRFIGRNAVLYNPKKQLIAEAPQIIVPADHPEKFEVVK